MFKSKKNPLPKQVKAHNHGKSKFSLSFNSRIKEGMGIVTYRAIACHGRPLCITFIE